MSQTNSEPDSQTIDFRREIKTRTKKTAFATYLIFLSVLHVTIVVILASLGDAAAVFFIKFLVGDPTHQSEVIKAALNILNILSIFGTATLYTIYLTYSLIDSIKHVTKMLLEKEH